MQVGDYVRTKSGYLRKIIAIYNGYVEVDDKCFNSYANAQIENDNIKKSSPNIIDLIEVGDVIEYRIDNVPLETKGYLKGITDITDEEMINEIKKDKNYHIKSIVTKEQFESIKYEVE